MLNLLYSGWDMKLTVYHHPVLRLNHDAIPLLPTCLYNMVLHKAQIYLYFCLDLVPHGGYMQCKI